MSITQQLLSILSKAEIRDVYKHYRWSIDAISSGKAEEHSRRIYVVARYILRRNNFFATSKDYIHLDGCQ